MPDYMRIYAKQDYLTPGAATTVEIIAETVRPDENTTLLDLGAGKGEAAATLASHHACRIVAIEPFDLFVHIATAKFYFFNLRDLASVVRANGRRLPIKDVAVDAAYCIGGPSIVGLDPALRELARVTRPGGHVIVSDIVWRAKPDSPLGVDWKWLAEAEQISPEDYAGRIEATGLTVERTHIHPVSDWENYFAPMLDVAREARTGDAMDPFFADEVDATVALERRAVEMYLDYATFIARKPEP
jgi:SAM-dependent methyltransferase